MTRLRLLVAIVGLLAAAALVWWVGPLVAIGPVVPLASALVRAVVIALLLLAFAVRVAWQARRQRRADGALGDAVAGPSTGAPADDTQARALDEQQLLRDRLREALTTSQRHRRQGLSRLPWYVLIGPPGAGKTTALQRAGLHFPLADDPAAGPAQPVAGVGGTRHCDWWFAEEAVLIDTAGRYTTQDSHAAVDSAAWRGFLALLRRYRPRRPLNGVIVALSVEDLLARDPAQRDAHAAAIRARIHELDAALGLRMPVYLALTKADRLPGFAEFFSTLSAEERAQPWGLTFSANEEDPCGRFGSEYAALAQQVSHRLVDRLSSETDVPRRAALLDFAREVTALQDDIQALLDAVCQPSRLHAPVRLRGVYLCSAQPAHFLAGWLRRVVFAEAELVGTNAKVERARVLAHGLGYAALAAAVAGAAVLWGMAARTGRAEIETLDQALRSVPAVLTADQADPWTGLLPRLDALAALAAPPDTPRAAAWGLKPAPALRDAAAQAYHRELQRLLLPRIGEVLAQRLDRAPRETDPTYAALKGYLMLGLPERRDAAYLQTLLQATWAEALPDQPANVARLQAHLARWLTGPAPALPLDGQRIEAARTTLARQPLAEIAYSRLEREALAHDEAALSLRDVLGPGVAAFERRDGRRVADLRVAGLYTARGLREVFLPQGLALAQALRGEQWVFGDARNELNARELTTLADDVARRYAERYIATWRAVLSELRPAPLRNPAQALDALAAWSGRESALRRLLMTVDANTRLTADRAAQTQLSARLTDGLQRAKDQLARSIATPDTRAVALAAGPAPRIEAAFSDLQAAVRADAAGVLLVDAPIEALGALFAELQALQSQDLAEVPQRPDSPAARRLTQLALAQPQPVRDWLLQVASGSGTLIERQQTLAVQKQRGDSGKALRAQLDAAWKAEVLPLCLAATQGRYPVDRRSAVDMPLKDFARLFAPAGLIDGFVKARLAPFIDASRSPWRWKANAEQVSIDASQDTLQQLETAARVRDAWFSDGGAQPLVEFSVRKPGGAARSLRWPSGDDAAAIAALGLPATEGPWAWWRLLDQAGVERPAVDRLLATWRLSPTRSTQAELKTASVLHPFQPIGIEHFACPKGL